MEAEPCTKNKLLHILFNGFMALYQINISCVTRPPRQIHKLRLSSQASISIAKVQLSLRNVSIYE